MDSYIFSAIIERGERHGFVVTFPDLPGCVTQGETIPEAYFKAKEALELHLYGMEEDGDPIPAPSMTSIPVPSGVQTCWIEAWMPLIRDKIMNKAVKKNVTIPKWLNDAAEQAEVNFSQLLQEALKRRLGVTEPPLHSDELAAALAK